MIQGWSVLMEAEKILLDNAEHPHGRSNRSRDEVWKMFDRVARRYDFLNRPHRGQHVLDLATGTADQIIFLFEKSHKVKSGVGMDLAEKMLEIGREKTISLGLSGVITLKVGDAMDIPADDNQFDAVTISFGIRNVIDVGKALREMYRVLKPNGRALVLEFSLPHNRLIRGAYLLYLRHIMPRVGALVSGDSYAYRYLNETIETFPYGGAFCDSRLEWP